MGREDEGGHTPQEVNAFMLALSAKVVHRAKHVNSRGRVSPLCATKPRAIDLRKATWTLSDKLVTCPRCKAMLKTRE